VLLLGVISFFAMYSSEQGKFGYHTQGHIYRFFIFFTNKTNDRAFLNINFFNIK